LNKRLTGACSSSREDRTVVAYAITGLRREPSDYEVQRALQICKN